MTQAAATDVLQPGETTIFRLAPGIELLIAALATPHTPLRPAARQLSRQMARQMLAHCQACRPEDIELITEAGKPPAVRGHPTLGLSLSHEAGLSLIAIRCDGPVGIDVLDIESIPGSDEELLALANDYLGAASAARLADLPATERRWSFASAWVAHEAKLKCLGLGLEEWHPDLEGLMAGCISQPLGLPAAYVGAVASPRI